METCYSDVVRRWVLTLLDFIFEYQKKTFNYPTLIFYQMGLSLFTLWQASRRAYRLNQTEECRNYYLCYEGTNQAAMVRLMAEKQIATAAIQGHFSMEGLAAMSSTVDPRITLLNNLSKQNANEDDAEEARRMFAKINAATGIDESIYGDTKTLLYQEVFDAKSFTGVNDSYGFDDFEAELDRMFEEPEDVTETTVEEVTAVPDEEETDDFFDILDGYDDVFDVDESEKKAAPVRRRARKDMNEGQVSFFDLL